MDVQLEWLSQHLGLNSLLIGLQSTLYCDSPMLGSA